MSNNELLVLTKKLIERNQSALQSFNKVRETGKQGDFYLEVKPFADQVKRECEEWLPLAIEWVNRIKPKHLHSVQLENTCENLQMVSVRAFFPDSSLKKFKSHVQSVDYVLNRMLGEIS
ncbi:YppE family protein [Heyndrickxia sp. NPDC080065]|uniref:YppE family protein n=1 Tax=Heyndrickxia sp. NPDC080065 TaxID=3390568 RepID=UPI003D094F59